MKVIQVLNERGQLRAWVVTSFNGVALTAAEGHVTLRRVGENPPEVQVFVASGSPQLRPVDPEAEVKVVSGGAFIVFGHAYFVEEVEVSDESPIDFMGPPGDTAIVAATK